MLEQLHLQFKNLFNAGGTSTALVVALVIAVIAFLYYLFFAKKNHKNPLWALIVLIIGVTVFLGFFFGGIKFGNAIGIGDIGALIGVFLFFFLASLYKYLSTPKDERRRKFM